jgi:uncharacterized protein YjbI with pentapeptide repeats
MTTTCTYTFNPADHGETSVGESWECPHDAVEGHEHCQFHMDPAQREAAGIADESVVEAFTQLIREGDSELRTFLGATLPEISLSHIEIEAVDQYPIDLRHTTIPDGITITESWFEERLDLRHSRLGGLALAECSFEHGLVCADATVTGAVDLFETIVMNDDADFSGATFSGPACFDEVDFRKDASFENATFEGSATFLGAEFYGRSNEIGDNTSFSGAVFAEEAVFEHATFEHVAFENVTFEGEIRFEKATVTGSCLFTGSTFEAFADFDEVRFRDDTSFAEVTFAGAADFRGVEFEGGAAVLEDDASFENAVFNEEVTFHEGRFRNANFTNTAFEGDADFERATFAEDAVFTEVDFDGVADFDEVVFDDDADFTGAAFHRDVDFRGSEFRGGTDYLDDNAIFEQTVFGDDADFRDATFTSANFLDAAFEGSVDFRDSEFSDRLLLRAASFGEKTYFNFTDAVIADGEITQPETGWIRFDMTKATLGTVTLRAVNPDDERELLDYFRICDTTFEGFDFGDHLGYLDRNDWNLHAFDDGDHDHEFALEMTPPVIEQTYLKAKNSASAKSNIKAAGEFRVKRQQFARQKFFDIARDTSETVGSRFQNLLRGVENLFLGVSCGYGLRLYRIAGVFIIFPLFAGFLFALGGDPFATAGGAEQISSFSELTTADGLEKLGIHIYFSYISFLTIGYGNIGPSGFAARFTAGALVYMNVILAGLFLYALIKRSEI